MEYFKNHKLSLGFNWKNNNMTYLLFSKILREKLLDFKVYEGIVNYPKHKRMKNILILSFCFVLFIYLFCV